MAAIDDDGRRRFLQQHKATTAHAGETLEAALDRADVAPYEAEHKGKNRACVAE